jgi:excisionase family DNA binding protein
VSNHPKRLLTDDEVAERFSVSRRTTARWREQGLIGFLRLPGGQKVLYLAQHVVDFETRLVERAKLGRGRPRKLLAIVWCLLQLLLEGHPT